ncbi:MAG: hypothetical protein M3Q08_10070 [Pseudomonadota bacterium]|nr:hypothetical protein [Pseudomonadota bacterium]
MILIREAELGIDGQLGKGSLLFKSIIAAAAATALAVTPVVANAQTGTDAPAPADAVEENESFRGHFITLAGFAALILAVALLFQGDEEPASP